MLMQGELNLSSSQSHVGSFVETLRHTMINQEFTFRKQLLELHQLYKTQQMLMQDLSWKESGKCSSWKASGQTALGNYPKTVSKEGIFSATPGVNLKDPRGQSMEEFFGSYNKHQPVHPNCQPRPLCFQKSSVWHFSHDGNDFPEKHRSRNCCEVIDLNADCFDNEITDPEKLKLSLGSSVCSKDIGSGMDCLYRRNYSCSNFTISVESSTKTTVYKDEGAASFPSSSIIYMSQNNTPPHGVEKCTHSNFLHNRQSEFNLSTEGCTKIVAENGVSAKQPKFPLSKRGLLDLNKVQFDDLSSDDDNVVAEGFTLNSSVSGDVIVENSEDRSLDVVNFGKLNSSTESVHLLPKGNSNAPIPNCISRNDSMKICAKNAEVNVRCMGKLKVVQLETLSKSQPGYSEYLSSGCKTKEEDIRMTSDSSNSSVLEHLSKVRMTKEIDCESSADGKIMHKVLQDGKGNLQCDGNSSKINTLQPGITVRGSDPSVSVENSTMLGSQDASVSPVRLDMGRFSSSERKNDLCKDKDFAGTDVLDQVAAESLIQLSFESPVCYEGSSRQAGSNRIEDKCIAQALSSSDSFELNVLNLEECNVDDDSVSSKAFEVNDSSKQDFSCKLRRGRRLKDFQKDILPGLASLSRHEILEDINILEQVLRSREYRKLRPGMADGDTRCNSLRSRQSRTSNIRRRRLR